MNCLGALANGTFCVWELPFPALPSHRRPRSTPIPFLEWPRVISRRDRPSRLEAWYSLPPLSTRTVL